ncbi:DinB family protein [Chitinophaga sp. CF418]|uniref:DinB family protein n=1 Tax=Chitinophaga sp. CF418 TaxID=1855287 RepID=UPI0009225C29|nr:DinB family protein [Chitinophaga sp. CF418]SHN44837.1 DinB superfamily protein [Chitinophaga sp. CF418]
MRNVIQSVREALLTNFRELDTWFEKDFDLLHFKPDTNQWNIREVLEHISLTNYFLLLIINKSTRRALERKRSTNAIILPADYQDKFDKIDVIGSRSFGWIRPEHLEPSGLQDMRDVRVLLKQQFAQCMYNLSLLKNGEGMLVLTNMSVNHLGKLDIYQYIYFLTKHIERHIRQMQRLAKQYEGAAAEDDAVVNNTVNAADEEAESMLLI